MNDIERNKIIETSWKLHGVVESDYLEHNAKKGDKDWHEKQRMLLADMALHLLQTTLKPGQMELDKLQNNLHAILTISDEFLPQAKLREASVNLWKYTHITT